MPARQLAKCTHKVQAQRTSLLCKLNVWVRRTAQRLPHIQVRRPSSLTLTTPRRMIGEEVSMGTSPGATVCAGGGGGGWDSAAVAAAGCAGGAAWAWVEV